MLVSTKGRYAMRVMIDLAEHSSGGYIPLRDVAERQEISEKYLESIVVLLSKAGLLEGLRGKGGGYKLTKRPEQYTAGSILKLTEGTMAPVACLEDRANSCPRASECRTLPMWEKLNSQLEQFFEGVTIADLMKKDAGGDFVI